MFETAVNLWFRHSCSNQSLFVSGFGCCSVRSCLQWALLCEPVSNVGDSGAVMFEAVANCWVGPVLFETVVGFGYHVVSCSKRS